VVVRLAARGVVSRIEVDTMHFKGNAPASCMIEGTDIAVGPFELPPEDAEWYPLLPLSPLLPHTRHLFIDEVEDAGSVTHVRLNVYPDGGVARLRLHGEIPSAERERHGLRFLNALPPRRAERELLACCGSTTWATRLALARPFADEAGLRAEADHVWQSLEPSDQLEAFAAHPRIGQRKEGSAAAARWSRAEQSRATAASSETLDALDEANRDYEQRFGFVFLICATGKSAQEVLGALRERLGHGRDQELEIAAKEQRKITQLRITRLLMS
jgi:allantoicase